MGDPRPIPVQGGAEVAPQANGHNVAPGIGASTTSRPVSPSPLPPFPTANTLALPTASSVPPAPARPTPVARPIPSPRDPQTVRANEEEQTAELSAVALRNAPPWLVSMVLHMGLMLLLALWATAVQSSSDLALLSYSSELGDPDSNSGFDMQGIEEEVVNPAVTDQSLPEVVDPFAAPPSIPLDPFGQTDSSDIVSANVGLALSGRTDGSVKQRLSDKFGGTGITMEAVRVGLEWLARQQRPDGSWSLQGPYAHGSPFEDTAAATAMALLAFQGDGHTHQRGKYRSQVSQGIAYLLKLQDKEGNFFHGERKHNWLYSQAQCTIALCELYGMSTDTKLREPAERAVRFAIYAQHPNGGWRYSPQTDRDTSVTGWMLMALQSARMAGLTVPPESLELVGKYLDEASSEGGTRYAYQPGVFADEVMTAEALLCREYLGWPQTDERLLAGADFLVEPVNLPTWDNRNVYFWYYATQTLHHLEGERWEAWNNVLREVLPANQVKTGPEAGSWHPLSPLPDRWGAFGGRLYVTCLSICTLEVYYRHLPLYTN